MESILEMINLRCLEEFTHEFSEEFTTQFIELMELTINMLMEELSLTINQEITQKENLCSLGVACSGGIDSITLATCMKLLVEFQKISLEIEGNQEVKLNDKIPTIFARIIQACRALPQLNLMILTVDHGLFPTSAQHAEELALFWKNHHVHCEILKANPELIKTGAGIEDGARIARYQAFKEIASRHNLRLILLGHHAQDQAETILMRLQSSTGLSGMRGIPPRRDIFLRPWLSIHPRIIHRVHRVLKLPVLIDPTNQDLSFLRNAVRHQVIPTLTHTFGEDWINRVVLTTTHLREDEQVMNELINELLKTHLSTSLSTGRISLNWPQGLKRSSALIRSILRHTYQRALYLLTPQTKDHRRAREQLPILEETWRGHQYQQRSLPLGMMMWGGRGQLHIFAPDLAPSLPQEVRITLPKLTSNTLNHQLPQPISYQWGEWLLTFTPLISFVTHPDDQSKPTFERGIDLERAQAPLRLQLPPKGARYQPQGTSGSKRVKRLWSDRHIAIFERTRLPVLMDHLDQILWCPYCRPADWLCVNPDEPQLTHNPHISWKLTWHLIDESTG